MDTEITMDPALVERAEYIGSMLATDSGFDVFYRGSDGEEALVVTYDEATNTTTLVCVHASVHSEPTVATITGTWADFKLPE